MDALTPVIRLTNLRDPEAVDRHFSSYLVDVAYVVGTGSSTADVSLDCIDLQESGNREWITEILRETLHECDEPQAIIEFL